MDHQEFRVKAKEMVDYIADYLESARDMRVYPEVQPGYLHTRLPGSAPELPESWDKIFSDVQEHIVPGIVHWQSPHMHAYFPALTSYPSILGDFLSSAYNVLCFTWASSPAGTELETIAMNWLGKMLGLPEVFLNVTNDSTGGGVIQTTASEATLVSLLAARTKALADLAALNPNLEAAELLGHLIGYCSDQAHSSVEKAGLIGLVRLRYIESDEHQSMRGEALKAAILEDKASGLVPFWVCATLGTTGSVAFDNLSEIGSVCSEHSIWLHVDAAYAGSAFICPEFRHWLRGVEMADSFAFNPSKWLMVNFDCTAMWVRDSRALHRTFNVNPIYLRHENSGKAIDYMVGDKKGYVPKQPKRIVTSPKGDFDYKKIEIEKEEETEDNEDDLYAIDNKVETRTLNGYKDDIVGCGREDAESKLEDSEKNEPLHWQIPLSRRFRALKLWFVLRNYGVSGLQKHIRESVRLAQKFEALVLADPRFEIPQLRNLGMVAFRLRGDNTLTECLLKRLNGRGKIHAVPACFKGTYVIRFTVTSQRTTNQDILDDWSEIKLVASEILVEVFGSPDGNVVLQKRPRVMLKETRELNPTFGTSLLLANSPMSPKVMNGTYAAICDYQQVLSSCANTFAQLNIRPQDNQEMRRRIRGIKTLGAKFSLDSCMDMVQGVMTQQTGLPAQEDELPSNGTTSPNTSDKSPEYIPLHPTKSHLSLPQNRTLRSRSIDVTLPTLEEALFSVDRAKNEVTITPTDPKTFAPENPFEGQESKLTIKGPGSYIKKLIQQFSEGSFDQNEMRERADVFCKKCLHYKGSRK